MSIHINTGGNKTCLFCYCITYDFRQTENDVPLHQIITTCNKHLPQEIIGSINWENAFSATENFCQDCHNLAIKLVTLNADLDRISREIETLSTNFANRIVSEKRYYELSTASTTIFHNESADDSNTSYRYIPNSANAAESDGNSLSLKTQNSPDIDLHNNSKSNYEDATAESAGDNTYVNELSSKHTNNNKRPAKQKRSQKVKKADSTTGSTEKTPPTILTCSEIQHHLDNDIASGFQCAKCQKRFSRLTILQKHDCSKPTFECEVCNKSFSGTGVLKLHMRSHTGEKPFKCDTCGKSFAVRCHLTTHLRVHSEEKPFKCDICDKTFRDDGSLKKHIKTHNKGEPKYKCDICSKSLATLKGLKVHLLYHKDEMPHKCVTCGKAFPSKVRLRRHERNHLEETPFKCELCGKAFNSNWKLKKHVEIHATERGFLCEECGKSFSTTSYLAIHRLTHTEKGPFVCEICRKKFPSSVRLKAHIDLCHSEKSIKCENCNIVFKSKKYLRQHQESLDCQVGPPYMCDQCDKSFDNKTSRRRHIAIEHLNENERPMYCCDVCPEIFYINTDLSAHKHRHRRQLLGVSKVNEKVFCESCKNDFENNANFQTHLQNRLEVIQCNFCQATFRTECECNIHSQKFHPNGEEFYKCKICSVTCGSERFLLNHMKFGHQIASSDEYDSDNEKTNPSSSSMGTHSTRRTNQMETENEYSSEGEVESDNSVDEEDKWNAKNQIDDNEDEKIEIKVEDVCSEIKREDYDYILGT